MSAVLVSAPPRAAALGGAFPQLDGIPVSLILDQSGMIRECEGDTVALFGYGHRELIARHVSELLPRLGYEELMHDGRLNSRLRYLCHIGLPFQIKCRGNVQCRGLLSLVDLGNPGELRVRLRVTRV